jgi:pimeloyl-ACP methyl ester carboxylesterase
MSTRRWLTGALGLILLLVAVAAAGAAWQSWHTARDVARYPAPGELIDIGGHRLHLYCIGTGAPVVVLDAGMGSSSLDWAALQPQIGSRTRVCSYDRAGYAYSDEGPLPRDSRRLVQELRTLLERARVPPPYVLVSHSFGGMNARLFAYEHPDEVAGLVLVDPSHEDQLRSWPASAATRNATGVARSCRDAEWARFGLMRLRGVTAADTTSVPPDRLAQVEALGRSTAWFRAFCGERRTFMSDSADQLRAARRPLTMPVVVLDGYYTMARESEAAGYPREEAAAREEVWHRLHRELATISPAGELVVADRSSHNVHIDQPELVFSATTRVVELARGGRP